MSESIEKLCVGERLRNDAIRSVRLEEGDVLGQRVASDPYHRSSVAHHLSPYLLRSLGAIHSDHNVVQQHQIDCPTLRQLQSQGIQPGDAVISLDHFAYSQDR